MCFLFIKNLLGFMLFILIHMLLQNIVIVSALHPQMELGFQEITWAQNRTNSCLKNVISNASQPNYQHVSLVKTVAQTPTKDNNKNNHSTQDSPSLSDTSVSSSVSAIVRAASTHPKNNSDYFFLSTSSIQVKYKQSITVFF